MKRTLVKGAAGFIGSKLVDLVVSGREDVVAATTARSLCERTVREA